ncbi:hypothetical protein SDC9_112902 [bioreactor metagenome]|uniref:Uncharacterized protein n=1 Tax=bioreactor metagenome TaxID=1076179 RepID=A0A645BLJ3_9ZZZZ
MPAAVEALGAGVDKYHFAAVGFKPFGGDRDALLGLGGSGLHRRRLQRPSCRYLAGVGHIGRRLGGSGLRGRGFGLRLRGRALCRFSRLYRLSRFALSRFSLDRRGRGCRIFLWLRRSDGRRALVVR